MSLIETVVEGTLKPDGSLELDENPNLPAGRVTVVIRQEAVAMVPKDDPFWQRMQAMWTAQNADGHVSRSPESEAFQRELRDEWDEHQQAIERLQEQCRQARHLPEGPKS